MGLTGDRRRVLELLALHDHVYFSDLRKVTTPGARLDGKLFYGCLISPATFAGASLAGTELICCAGGDAGALPADAEARRAVEDALRGEWDPILALVEQPSALAANALEHVVAIAAVAMTDAQ